MANPNVSNFGKYMKVGAAGGARLVAAGTGDATEVTSAAVDRLGYGSGAIVLAAHANNTAAKKLTITSIKISDSADNSSFATGVEVGTGTIDLVTGTGDQFGSYQLNINLASYRRYVKILFTPDHTASNTDTAEVTCCFVLGGAVDKPAA